MVDKPNQGNTITIKVNGEYQNFNEESQNYDSEMSKSTVSTVINGDPDVYEENVFLEAAATQEPVDESFDWIIPESSEDDIEEYTNVQKPTSKKSSNKKLASISKNSKGNNSRAFGPFLISGIFAILIGTTFGIMMLKVMSPPVKKAGSQPRVTENAGTNQATTTTTTTTTTIKSLTTYVVQGGLYSSKDSAKDAVNQSTAIGVPAKSIEIDGKEYLFLGIADSQDSAKSLGSLVKTKGFNDAFAKPLEVGEKKVSDLNDTEKSFLEAVPQIYQSLVKMTASGILTKTISETSTKEMDQQLSTNGIKAEKIKQLQAELTSAKEKVNAFQKSKDSKSLSDAQQHLLNFLSVYYSLK
jgi:stage II sporulation protein B